MLLDGLGWSHYSVFTLYYDSNPRSRTVWGGAVRKPVGTANRLIEAGFSSLMPVIAV